VYQTFTCPGHCPGDKPKVTADVWHGDGDWYTADSDLCSAAFHATGIAGGTYDVQVVNADFLEGESKRVSRFESVTKFGIASKAWTTPYPLLFHFEAVRQPDFTLNGLTYQPNTNKKTSMASSLVEQRKATDGDRSIPITPALVSALSTASQAKQQKQ